MPVFTEMRRRASELAFQGHHKRAARLYEQLLTESPRDPQLALRAAEQHRKVGRTEHALGLYERAAQLYRLAGLEAKARAAEYMVRELSEQHRDESTQTWWRRWLGLSTTRRNGPAKSDLEARS
jgi:hypothetical protein